jgi:glycosyltransferase involved in cell wall biosynthesis
VDDLLEISDFLVLPTRFAGESMPLTLIQAILARVPIISTNVGQIADMLVTEAGAIGVALEPVAEDGAFIEQLCAAMQQAASGDLPVSAEAFAILARRFSMEVCADSYLEVYGLIPEGKKECSFLKKRTKKLLSLV